MIENFPDRFLYGSDWKDGRRRGFEGRSYRMHIRKVRPRSARSPRWSNKFRPYKREADFSVALDRPAHLVNYVRIFPHGEILHAKPQERNARTAISEC